MQQEEKIIKIGIDSIVPNRYQPRKKFDENDIQELAESIKTYGIINPILVRKKEDKFEIIAGERRYRAAIQAGLKEVPIIEKSLEDTTLAEIALIENIQRKDLSPIEEAQAYEEIMKLSDVTQTSLGQKLGKSQSSIANKLRLLNLPNPIKEALLNRNISERHARSLMKVEDETKQLELLERIIEEKLTVKDLDNIINEQKITEEDIQNAINEIMKSLKISEEENEINQKEEKESDKMNNDNFFPNFNNTMGANNNVSLNTMNMQSIENSQMTPVQETVMPTIQTPTFEMPILEQPKGMPQVEPPMMNQPVEQPIITPQPEIPLFQGPEMNTVVTPDVPLFGGNINPETVSPAQEVPVMMQQPMQTPEIPASPIPNFSFEPPMMNQPVEEPVMTPSTEVPLFQGAEMNTVVTPDVPLFGGNINPEPVVTPQVEVPVVENIQAPVQPETPVIMPEPLPVMPNVQEEVVSAINQPVETNINETFYEVPVNISPVIEEPVANEDKLTKVQEILSQNGIEYKTYSNESGHCIIIELTK